MFSKASSKQAAAEAKKDMSNVSQNSAPERSVPSIISADLTITGDLSSNGEIQVDGKIEGDIRCASLIIGISGSVTGEVNADSVRMHGSVNGQVNAKSVFLASTARMVGDITHESLAIEPGAFMEGHCRRMVQPPAPSSSDLAIADGRKDSRKMGGDSAKLDVAPAS